jgi:hypothetical protein
MCGSGAFHAIRRWKLDTPESQTQFRYMENIKSLCGNDLIKKDLILVRLLNRLLLQVRICTDICN